MEFSHIPVLLNEAVDALAVDPDGIYVDGTAGGGGHSEAIAKKLENGRLIAIDQDPDAIAAASKRLRKYPQAQVVQSNFSQIPEVLDTLGILQVAGVLLDIGVSSHQLDTAERGFSFHSDAPLDMRMSQSGRTAADLVNNMSVYELADVFSHYGEEKFSMRIARAICGYRENNFINSTAQLSEIVKSAVPAAARRDGHPARKVFQALRIAVNGELDVLEAGMKGAFERLQPGGRLAIITFHSLEARIVKKQMNEWCTGCTCPPEFPVCVCGKKPRAKMLSRKPIEPSAEEIKINPRSRSSLLRVCIKEF